MSKLITQNQYNILRAFMFTSDNLETKDLGQGISSWTNVQAWAEFANTTNKSARGTFNRLVKNGLLDTNMEGDLTYLTVDGWRAWKDAHVAYGEVDEDFFNHPLMPNESPEAPQEPKTPVEPKKSTKKPGAKLVVREMLETGGSYTMAQFTDKGFTETSVRTALSDLKNEKYAGEQGPLKIAKNKDKETGEVSWTLPNKM